MKHFTRAAFVNLQVVHALILRETRTRYGRHHLGYLWAMATPLSWIGMFAAMGYLMDRQPPQGMGMVGCMAAGFYGKHAKGKGRCSVCQRYHQLLLDIFSTFQLHLYLFHRFQIGYIHLKPP